MDWKHKVSISWMRDRQEHITASEIRSLIPLTASGNPRKVTEMDYLKVYSKKVAQITEADCWSYGAAARGHILEPYAVRAFNDIDEGLPTLHHWDDVLIGNGREHGLSYSPDALDVEMGSAGDPKVLGEVKSYGTERHLVTAQTPKEKLEERWQVATAMAVSPTIEEAYLILFNPDIKIPAGQVYVFRFDRADLAGEIETVLEVEQKWLDYVEKGPLASPKVMWQGESACSTEDIRKVVSLKQRLNP